MRAVHRFIPAFVVAINAYVALSAMACPFCKDSVPNSDAQQAGGVPSGFNNTIYLMLGCLLLLNLGCALRVSSEILAYEGYWLPAWSALPWSAVLELAAVTLFAANLVLTFKQPPAHQMRAAPTA